MMKLGLFLNGVGHHIAAWRDPAVNPEDAIDFKAKARIAQIGEQACFDLLFTADSNATFGPDDPLVWKRTGSSVRFEPITLFSALAAVTERIGLVCTATTTYSQPYRVARQFASMDLISGGRAGWNVVTSSAPAEALNFSHAAHPDHEKRYARAGEYIDVVVGLWSTWQAGGLVHDQAEGVYLDPDKQRFLNHQGEYYAVRGPMTTPPSPQGRPVIVEAGQSEPGKDLAARTAEVVFAVQQDFDACRALRLDLRARARTYGRDPDTIKVMPGLLPILGKTQEDADAEFRRIQALIHPDVGIPALSDVVGMDLRGYDLDGPLPDVAGIAAQQGRQRVIIDMARNENLTIRQLYERVSGARAHRILCGTGESIANEMARWVEGGAVDGFNIMPLTFPGGLVRFCEEVLPVLQRRGQFRSAYSGTTLREHLGLPIPVLS
jgi:N-acetyl-S-(2-succino)cysteine monooxygenase